MPYEKNLDCGCVAPCDPQPTITEKEKYLREALLEIDDLVKDIHHNLIGKPLCDNEKPQIENLNECIGANLETAKQIRENLMNIRRNL